MNILHIKAKIAAQNTSNAHYQDLSFLSYLQMGPYLKTNQTRQQTDHICLYEERPAYILLEIPYFIPNLSFEPGSVFFSSSTFVSGFELFLLVTPCFGFTAVSC